MSFDTSKFFSSFLFITAVTRMENEIYVINLIVKHCGCIACNNTSSRADNSIILKRHSRKIPV